LAGAATYYVKTDGSDDSTGLTVARAWLTLKHACETISSGDTVLVRAGTYDEGQNFYKYGNYYVLADMPSGSAGDYTTFKGYPGDAKPLIIGDETYSAVNLQNIGCLYGLSYLCFDSLSFKYGYKCIFFWEGADDIIFRNCDFDSSGWGTYDGENPSMLRTNESTTNCYRLLVEYCNFSHVWANNGANNSAGVQFYHVDSGVVRYCTFKNCGEGVMIKGADDWVQNVHVYGNVFYKEGSPTVNPQYGVRMPFGGYSRKLYIHNNIFYGGFTTAALLINYAAPSMPPSQHLREVYVYNNTLHATTTENLGIGIKVVDSSGGTYFSDSVFFFNNLILCMANRNLIYNLGNDKYGDAEKGSLGPNSKYDYNAIFTTSTSNTSYIWNEAGGGDWTLTQMRSNTIHCDNDSTFTDSTNLFVHQGNHDYRLDSGGDKYLWLSTGGAGNTTYGGRSNWPTYIGAEEPDGEVRRVKMRRP
jgi:hypothetical protein